MPRPPRGDAIAALGLFLASALLFGIDLGVAPLRDWDEGTVAQVARAMALAPSGSGAWLAPTLHGEPYLNKPPLVHWMIAVAFRLGGVGEWTARLPGALLGAASVPVVFAIGRAAFGARAPALLAAAVYGTLLPVVRHGRLAMLDAALVFFVALAFRWLLRARDDPRWALAAGLALALAGLSKGLVALPFAGLALLFVRLEAPHLLAGRALWIGLAMPVAALGAWYARLLGLGVGAVRVALVEQSFRRVLVPIEGNAGPAWYYALEVAKYAWPWLVFLPAGLAMAWAQRRSAWARLVFTWGGGYLIAASIAGTKLPWYAYPLYVPIALVVGAHLGAVWTGARRLGRGSALALGGLGLAAGVVTPGLALADVGRAAVVAVAGVALTLAVAAALAWRRDRRAIAVLLAGCYLSLLVFFTSDHWLWELREDYPVPPVAAMVRAASPEGAVILTTHPTYRPSLDYYSGRRVVPVGPAEIARRWDAVPQPFALVPAPAVLELAARLAGADVAGRAGDWVLLTRR